MPSSRRLIFKTVQQAVGMVDAKGRQRKGAVIQQFHQHAARAHHDHRAELGITHHAQGDFHASGRHGSDRHARPQGRQTSRHRLRDQRRFIGQTDN